MEILFRYKCLYRVTMAPEAVPNAVVEKMKGHNRRDEAYGLLCLSISRDLLFNIDSTYPNEVWENIEEIFRNIDEMSGHKIKNELISLSTSSFESLQLYFTKFKALVFGVKEQLVLTILSNIVPYYSFFVSNFYSTELTARI